VHYHVNSEGGKRCVASLGEYTMVCGAESLSGFAIAVFHVFAALLVKVRCRRVVEIARNYREVLMIVEIWLQNVPFFFVFFYGLTEFV
jgi:hypothetical protein